MGGGGWYRRARPPASRTPPTRMACPGSASPVGVNGYLSTRLNAPTIPLKEPFLVLVVQSLQLTVGPLGACSRFVCEISSQKRQQINLSFGFIESRQLSGGGGKWVDGSSPQQRHGRTPEGTESFSVAAKRPLSTTAVPRSMVSARTAIP